MARTVQDHLTACTVATHRQRQHLENISSNVSSSISIHKCSTHRRKISLLTNRWEIQCCKMWHASKSSWFTYDASFRRSVELIVLSHLNCYFVFLFITVVDFHTHFLSHDFLLLFVFVIIINIFSFSCFFSSSFITFFAFVIVMNYVLLLITQHARVHTDKSCATVLFVCKLFSYVNWHELRTKIIWWGYVWPSLFYFQSYCFFV